MKNISKIDKNNIDAIAEAKKDKNFQKYSEEAKVKIKFAVEVFNKREAMSLSQKQLAEKIGTTQKIISRIENGDMCVGIGLENRIIQGLGFTSDNLSRIFNCPSSVVFFREGVKNKTFDKTFNISMQSDDGVNVELKTNTNTINK
jgi:transcriptional regulator with XRE-family HTH domain